MGRRDLEVLRAVSGWMNAGRGGGKGERDNEAVNDGAELVHGCVVLEVVWRVWFGGGRSEGRGVSRSLRLKRELWWLVVLLVSRVATRLGGALYAR